MVPNRASLPFVLAALSLVVACGADAEHDDDALSLTGGELSTSSGPSFSTGTGASGPTGGEGGAGGGAVTVAGPSTAAATGATTATTGAGGASSVCGDGELDAGEVCDDGNLLDGDYCATDCQTVTGACGDGTQQDNESCDDGAIDEGCDTWHDGGDGACAPPGTCSGGFFLVGGACEPELATGEVLIHVSNTCVMNVTPLEITVPAGQRLRLSYRNIGNDYPVDVWKSYIGGYLDLPPGGTWNEQYQHCAGPNAYTEYADISTACSSFRLLIRCL